MDKYVTLIGAEAIGHAGAAMSRAASEMRNAASEIESALVRHQQFLDDWLLRFEQVLAAKVTS